MIAVYMFSVDDTHVIEAQARLLTRLNEFLLIRNFPECMLKSQQTTITNLHIHGVGIQWNVTVTLTVVLTEDIPDYGHFQDMLESETIYLNPSPTI
jgi:hypothetical protein